MTFLQCVSIPVLSFIEISGALPRRRVRYMHLFLDSFSLLLSCFSVSFFPSSAFYCLVLFLFPSFCIPSPCSSVSFSHSFILLFSYFLPFFVHSFIHFFCFLLLIALMLLDSCNLSKTSFGYSMSSA